MQSRMHCPCLQAQGRTLVGLCAVWSPCTKKKTCSSSFLFLVSPFCTILRPRLSPPPPFLLPTPSRIILLLPSFTSPPPPPPLLSFDPHAVCTPTPPTLQPSTHRCGPYGQPPPGVVAYTLVNPPSVWLPIPWSTPPQCGCLYPGQPPSVWLPIPWSTPTQVVAYTLVMVFDIGGALFGLSSLAGLLDDGGTVKGATVAYLASAAGSAVGALTGTTPLIISAESAVGIKDGGKTGLVALVVAGCFTASLGLAPLLQVRYCAWHRARSASSLGMASCACS
eukprot:363885-Chlamydomonas_euryale.AAC.33